MVFRQVGPNFSFPDHTRPITGQDGAPALQSNEKLVTRTGAPQAVADIDVPNTDLTDGPFETNTLDIGGTSGVAIFVQSDDGNAFEAEIELRDETGSVLGQIDSSVFTDLSGTVINIVVPVFSDRVKIYLRDTSGATQNVVSGSMNANIGTPSQLNAQIQGGSVAIEGVSGNIFGDQTLNTAAPPDSTSLVTYLSRALNAVGLDEFVTRVTNASGTQIDPMNQDALQSVANDELRSRVFDSTGTQIDPAQQESYDSVYTSIDLNTTGTTTIYNGSTQAKVYSVHLQNGGGTADVRLEITDGTNTAVLDDPGAGGSIHFEGEVVVAPGDDLQITVETAEGSALTGTAVVSRGEL